MPRWSRHVRDAAARPFWIALGVLCVALGVAGIFLPLLPTTPFLLAAAYCFARSSPRLHQWLTMHPRLGPPIEAWRRHGAISRRAKMAAVGAMAATLAMTVALRFSTMVVVIQALTLVCVSLFILTRPDPPAGV